MLMTVTNDTPLAPYTSFNLGGPAEHFALIENGDQLLEALKCTLPETQLWTIGFGSNSLISDEGLQGMVLCIRGGAIEVNGNHIVADAGVWWDDIVQKAIAHNLWGIEFLSEVPGSLGGALYINITAYGQSVGPRVEWIEVWDRVTSQVKRLTKDQLTWGYKSSLFQTEAGRNYVIIRASFLLSNDKTDELVYQKALDCAEELKLDTISLSNRRKIIIEARKQAGSLWNPTNTSASHTVGSFFRNPTVSRELADKVMSFDESHKTAAQIKSMNKVHGGDELRVSAAHVMLAAGFKRGQTWGKVKLNDNNVLKIEALEGAKAQDVFNVATLIKQQCLSKLGIKLEPEARILGDFQNKKYSALIMQFNLEEENPWQKQ